MDEIITEKSYPIRNIWLFKKILPILILPIYFTFLTSTDGELDFSLPSVFIFLLLLLIFTLILGIPIIINVLRRAYFHYSFDEHFIVLHQGIISKQNRNVPYGRIQGLFINQGLFDRIFGLASLTLEDFSGGGKSAINVDGYIGSGKSRREALGFVGNKIHIPGLKKRDAEELKSIILRKIKENPIEDSQSGL